MKVVYDVSLFGINYHSSKSGLCRVAENIARGLIESKKCDLTFCNTLSLNIWVNSLKYLEANPDFARTPFINQEIAQSSHIKFYNLIYKFIKSENLLNLLEYKFQPLSLTELKGKDIFHSLYHQLPKQVKSVKKLKKFLTVHDLIPIFYPHFFNLDKNLSGFHKNFNLKQALNSLDTDTWILCVSHSTKNDLCNYLNNKIDENKVFVTYLAASKLFYPCLDAELIKFTKQRYCIPDRPYILSLSTLEPRKNIEHTIRCFANLVQQEKIKDLCLVLAGQKGWNYNGIFKEIANYKQLKERIILTGYVADQDLAALYSGALVFVYPSFYEGFGLPPLEAMQCGTPVITSNTSSLPEVVGDAGIIINPLDKDGLCQSILKIYSKACLRDALSLKSRERAKQFSWSKCTQQTIAAYKHSLL